MSNYFYQRSVVGSNSPIWSMPEKDRETLINSAPRLNAGLELNNSSYEKSGKREQDSAFNLGLEPIRSIHPFDAKGDYEKENAAMSMHRGKCTTEPWSGKLVTAVSYRGTEFLSRTPVMADTSFAGAKAYYNKLNEASASAVYQLLEDRKSDVFAIDGHSLGGFASGEFLADLVEAAQKKWKNDPKHLQQFLAKIDYSSINSIGYSARAIEAIEAVNYAGGKIKTFIQPDDVVRKIPSAVGNFGESAKAFYTSGIYAPTAEEYRNNTLFDLPQKYSTNLVMPDGYYLIYNIDAHRITYCEPVIKDAMSIYQTRKEMAEQNVSLVAPNDFGKNLRDRRNQTEEQVKTLPSAPGTKTS